MTKGRRLFLAACRARAVTSLTIVRMQTACTAAAEQLDDDAYETLLALVEGGGVTFQNLHTFVEMLTPKEKTP